MEREAGQEGQGELSGTKYVTLFLTVRLALETMHFHHPGRTEVIGDVFGCALIEGSAPCPQTPSLIAARKLTLTVVITNRMQGTHS